MTKTFTLLTLLCLSALAAQPAGADDIAALTAAANNGNTAAQRSLGRHDEHAKIYEEAYFWFLLSANGASNALRDGEVEEAGSHLTPEQRAAIENRVAVRRPVVVAAPVVEKIVMPVTPATTLVAGPAPAPPPVPAAPAENRFFRSVTVAGGPIATHHFQEGRDDFDDYHQLGILKAETADYGTWGLYVLSPNSVHRFSIGGGYVTHPYVIPLGPTELELSAALGIVSGYQSYPVPMLAGEARLLLYRSGGFNAGIEMAGMPYIAEDRDTGNSKVGVVGTTPFLSLRYTFN